MFFRFAVKTFQIRQRHFACVFILLLFEIRNQHTELGAPVADVVGADDVMAEKLQRAHGGIADNGGTQVTNVHLFRHVWRGVIHHDGLRRDLRNADTLVQYRALHQTRQIGRIEENIDKARTRDFDFAGDPGEIEMVKHLLR